MVEARHEDEPNPQRGGRGRGDVVYTALMGEYEALTEEPQATTSDVHFVCFTDDPSLTSDTWRVELVEPKFPMDPIRSARWIKIFGDESIWANYDRSLWVDNRVSLKKDPSETLDELLQESWDMALFEHSFRDRVVDEFDAVARGGYDDADRVYEQLLHYAEWLPQVLDERPLWTGFMARRHNDQVLSAMQTWVAHVCRYSRRDQLSVNVSLTAPKLSVRRLEGDNRESDWHAWPPLSDALKRKSGTRVRAFEHSIRVPLARLRAVEREQTELVEAQAVSAAKRDKVVAQQRTRIDELQALLKEERTRRQRTEARLEKVRERAARLTERVQRLSRRVEALQGSAAPPDEGADRFRRQARRVRSLGRRVVAKAHPRRDG